MYLYNGAKTEAAWDSNSPEFVDDWKPEERQIEADAVQVTYGCHVKVYIGDELIDFWWGKNGLIFYEGVFYGDFTVSAKTDESGEG